MKYSKRTCTVCDSKYIPSSKINTVTCGSYECRRARAIDMAITRSRRMNPPIETKDEIILRRNERVRIIKELRLSGKSYTYIAKELGISRQAIRELDSKYIIL